MPLFQSNLRKQIRKLPKIVKFVRINYSLLFKIIHCCPRYEMIAESPATGMSIAELGAPTLAQMLKQVGGFFFAIELINIH